ncbi:hypothetical protein Syun_010944 [Stephania yunnanensis]|uniref:Uncharacterized protein n=1 Tax=Stephania yunnanensis TaxID=152371 RepID=A0AAP0JXC9_9MAGN
MRSVNRTDENGSDEENRETTPANQLILDKSLSPSTKPPYDEESFCDAGRGGCFINWNNAQSNFKLKVGAYSQVLNFKRGINHLKKGINN